MDPDRIVIRQYNEQAKTLPSRAGRRREKTIKKKNGENKNREKHYKYYNSWAIW